MHNPIRWTVPALTLALFLAGCAPHRRLEPAAGGEPVRLEAYAHLVPNRGAFEVRRAGEPPRVVEYSVAPPAEGPWWTMRLDGLRTVEVSQTDGGDVILRRELDEASKSAVTYDPPIPVLPGHLNPGEVIRGSSRVVVSHAESGAVRDKGTCDYTLEVLGPRVVETPAGRFDAVVVRNVRKLDLRLARATVTVDTSYAAGTGEVAEHVREEVRALGLFGSVKEEERVRVR